MPRVSVEQEAIHDPRLRSAARRIPSIRRPEILGWRLLSVWSLVTQTQNTQQRRCVVADALGMRDETQLEALVDVGLAEDAASARDIDLAPMAELFGRFDWLGDLRGTAPAGGRVRAATAARDPATGQMLPRDYRAEIVEALSAHGLISSRMALAKVLHADRTRLGTVLDELLADGIVIETGDGFRLAEEAAALELKQPERPARILSSGQTAGPTTAARRPDDSDQPASAPAPAPAPAPALGSETDPNRRERTGVQGGFMAVENQDRDAGGVASSPGVTDMPLGGDGLRSAIHQAALAEGLEVAPDAINLLAGEEALRLLAPGCDAGYVAESVVLSLAAHASLAHHEGAITEDFVHRVLKRVGEILAGEHAADDLGDATAECGPLRPHGVCGRVTLWSPWVELPTDVLAELARHIAPAGDPRQSLPADLESPDVNGLEVQEVLDTERPERRTGRWQVCGLVTSTGHGYLGSAMPRRELLRVARMVVAARRHELSTARCDRCGLLHVTSEGAAACAVTPSQRAEAEQLDAVYGCALGVVRILGEITGRIHRLTDRVKAAVSVLLAEGYTQDQIESVVRCKASEWAGTKMASQAKPSTLLRPENFRKYFDEDVAPGLVLSPEDAWKLVRQAIGRDGVHRAPRLPAQLEPAVRTAGWRNLCMAREGDAKRMFLSAFQGGSGPGAGAALEPQTQILLPS